MLHQLAKQLTESIKDNKNLIWRGGNKSLVEPLVNVMLDFPEKPEGFSLQVKEPKLYKKVILVSGGMDSTIMWHMNKDEKDKIGLYGNLGQKYADKEIEAINRAGIEDFIVKYYPLRFGEDWKHIIPTRNFVLITLAEEFVAHEGEIWIGAVQGESTADKGDKSDLFFQLVEELIWRTHRKKVTIKHMKEKTKNDWLKWYLDETGDLNILDTITCFNGTEKACGTCQACVRKWISLRYCKIDFEGFFEVNPYIGGKEYIDKYKKNFAKAIQEKDYSHYSADRAKQDLQVILDYEMLLKEK